MAAMQAGQVVWEREREGEADPDITLFTQNEAQQFVSSHQRRNVRLGRETELKPSVARLL